MRFLVCAVLMAIILYAPAAYAYSVDDIIKRTTQNQWHVGMGITPGDFFTYAVCDGTPRIPYMDESCYTIRMDFYAELESYGRYMWIVQAEITTEDTTIHRIFLIDSETMKITTVPADAGYAHSESVGDTILYLAEFANKATPKNLLMGHTWGTLDSIDTNAKLIVALNDSVQINEQTLDVSILQHKFFETSAFAIHRDIPFPIYAVMYDPYWPLPEPPILFTLELTDYHAAALTNRAASRDDIHPTHGPIGVGAEVSFAP